ncbi:hypothetical protein LINPERHAP1_LOCUS30606, partial [Linum perenne]
MTSQNADKEWKMRRCDCEVPVRQRVVHLGSRVMRIFLECPEWEYGMGCHYC